MRKEAMISFTGPSADSSGSMPLGGHNTGCNVWVERDGDIRIYLSQSGAFDENNTLLKLGRLRISLNDINGNSLIGEDVVQTLYPERGEMTVVSGDTKVLLWSDVTLPRLHVEITTSVDHVASLRYESWRHKPREVTYAERHQCRDYDGYNLSPVITEADTVEPCDGEIVFFHRNDNGKLVFDKLIEQQKLEPIRKHYPNQIQNRTFGGRLFAEGMKYEGVSEGKYLNTDHAEYKLISETPVKKTSFTVDMLTCQCDTLDEWRARLDLAARKHEDRDYHNKWWREYFDRSYIEIDTENESGNYSLGLNYQFFRYMLGCNYYGEYPTKFNGGLFTFDEGRTPDFRMWGGGTHTAQNQRLLYWPMLKTGDFDAMIAQFEFYRRITPAVKANIRHFHGHDGAAFPEQIDQFGTCTGIEYSWNRRREISDADPDNAWVKFHYTTALEFGLMILEYARYCGGDITKYHEFIESVIIFYDEHYPKDDNGKMYVYPSTALESYKGDPWSAKDDYGALNPMDVVVGVKVTSIEYSRYLKKIGENNKAERFLRIAETCPDLPIGKRNEKKIYLPAEKCNPVPFNCELPQLYMVFPYNINGLTENEKEISENTYFFGWDDNSQIDHISWHQMGIFAARLGLTKEAFEYLQKKLNNGPRRFPAFWGPGHDWTPDHNWGGSAMIGLQEMLMQCYGDEIRILPAWPSDIDVSFKLWAPGNTVVECEYKDGEIKRLSVTPESRVKDVVFHTSKDSDT